MDLTGYAITVGEDWLSFFTSNTYDLLFPLVVYTFGLAFYALFVWKFYNFLSKRDVFKLDLSKYEFSNHPNLRKAGSMLMYVVKHLIILPLFIFLWFLTLSALLIIMSKNQSVPEIMLLSMAVVSAIRITSYFKEDIAKDLAKILPFTLIGLILLDPTYFQSINVFDRISQLPDMALNVISYLLFTQILEFSLRILYGLKVLIFGSNE
ncbi:MAG: hypothetical protein GOU97_04290 [Nanoarchaeota archaeon]|nr:hypothetical protein [Nanoarchaeota archaeon]